MGRLKQCENEQCLTSNNLNAKFCLKCGHAFSNEEPAMISAEPESSRLSILKRPWIISAISVIVLGAMLYAVGLFVYDKDKVIKAAIEAAETDNVDLLFEQITVPAGVKYSEELYKNYLVENNLHNIATSIESVVTMLEEDEESVSYVFDTSGNRLLEVLEEEKYGIYSTYTLKAVGYELYMQANMTDVTFEMLGETMKTDESGYTSLGMFLPSAYTLIAQATTSFGELMHEQQIVHPTSFEESTVDLYFESYNIYLDGSYPEAELIIDGESTGQTIAQYDGVIASVPEGQRVSVSAVLEVEGETYESETFEVSSEETLYFEFPEYEVIQVAKTFGESEAQNFLENYRVAYEQAIMAADFSYISDYFKADTEVYKDYEKFVNDHSKLGTYEYTFKDNVFNGYEQKDYLTVSALTFESFTFTSEDGTYFYERDKQYTLIFDDTKEHYVIENIEILETKKTRQ